MTERPAGGPLAPIELFIEGDPVSVGAVQFLFQHDPTPGGCTYRLILRDLKARRSVTVLLGGAPVVPAARGTIERLMAELDLAIARLADVPREAKYFINTVDRLKDLGEQGLAFHGRCSKSTAFESVLESRDYET